MRSGVFVLSILGVVLFLVSPGRALTVAPMSLGQMTTTAETVVRARCIDRTPTRTSGSGIETVVRFEVLEVAKGTSFETIEVREPGGEIDDRKVVVPGAPRSAPGDEAVLFLERGPQGHYRVVGMALGYLPVVATSPGAERVRVAPHFSPDLSERSEGGALKPVRDVLDRVRRLAESSP